MDRERIPDERHTYNEEELIPCMRCNNTKVVAPVFLDTGTMKQVVFPYVICMICGSYIRVDEKMHHIVDDEELKIDVPIEVFFAYQMLSERFKQIYKRMAN